MIQLKQKENKNRRTIMLNHKDHCLSIEPLQFAPLNYPFVMSLVGILPHNIKRGLA